MHYIAMWSGPRNISTAMMRSWGSRADTYVHDEPFYAHYLKNTHHDHPGKDEIIATYETDWRKVVEVLTGEIPRGKTIYYQKHMTHHQLQNMTMEWMLTLKNCFLIREPRKMVMSLAKVLPNPEIEQTGLPQQVQIFDFVRRETGKIPPVIDSVDVLKNPRLTLTKLCDAVGVPFDEAMLSWEAGKRDTDGIWAKHWYAAVERSTGFEPYNPEESPEDVPGSLASLVAECEGLYQAMSQHKL